MTSFQDVMMDSKSAGRTTLIYMLLLTNVIGLSIFLDKNMCIHSKTKDTLNEKDTPSEADALQKPISLQFSQPEDIPIHECGIADKGSEKIAAEAVKESFEMEKQNICHDDYKSENEKIIDFKKAMKEIKNKESSREAGENLKGPKEPLKTLVWHFPKTTSSKGSNPR
ncbi:MAG: hypothetical protein PWQ97_128 [Tepidanaerobacteraceae bacterium]|nr:hypothetical protein [Tepidanaerobacteraceae bacterium]